MQDSINLKIMKKFEFSSKRYEQIQIFSGQIFYDVYKDAEFLRQSENVETILSKGYEMRNQLKEVQPGCYITVGAMSLERNTPLLIKRTGPNVNIENFEFTANRLSGLVAAYAFDNRLRFPVLNSSEAQTLGLVWKNDDEYSSCLFLSSVTGSEHFYKQFKYYPLVCALRKLQLKKITLEPVIKIAKVKNPEGVTMGKDIICNLSDVQKAWKYFPGTTTKDFLLQLESVPYELKKIFCAK